MAPVSSAVTVIVAVLVLRSTTAESRCLISLGVCYQHLLVWFLYFAMIKVLILYFFFNLIFHSCETLTKPSNQHILKLCLLLLLLQARQILFLQSLQLSIFLRFFVIEKLLQWRRVEIPPLHPSATTYLSVYENLRLSPRNRDLVETSWLTTKKELFLIPVDISSTAQLEAAVLWWKK